MNLLRYVATPPIVKPVPKHADCKLWATRSLVGPSARGVTMSKKLQHILVVDSHQGERAELAAFLAQAGYAVVEAASTVQCMDCVERELPALVIFDPRMPVADGFHLLVEIRERYSADILPIIVVTSDSDDQMMVRALTSGANDYIHKRADRTSFVARVYNHISLSQTRRQLDEQRGKLNHILSIQRVLGNLSPEALLVEDSSGVVVYRNDTLDRLCGGRVPNTTKDALYMIFPPEVVASLHSERRERGTMEFEREIQWSSPRERCVRVRVCPATPMPGEDLRVWGFRDITHERLLEHQHQAERQLASVSQFVRGITTHVESLLADISRASQMLKRVTAEQAAAAEHLGTIDDRIASGRRLAEKTRLAVGHDAGGSADSEDVGCVLEVLAESARVQVGERITLVLEVEDDLPKVMMSLRDLSGIFGNVLRNAIDAIGDTGEIVISARRDPISDTVRVQFEDSGAGMEEGVLNRIGEPFYTTKVGSRAEPETSDASGRGLGVWSARHLVEAHGGSLSVSSRPGNGTKVVVDLPGSAAVVGGQG